MNEKLPMILVTLQSPFARPLKGTHSIYEMYTKPSGFVRTLGLMGLNGLKAIKFTASYDSIGSLVSLVS